MATSVFINCQGTWGAAAPICNSGNTSFRCLAQVGDDSLRLPYHPVAGAVITIQNNSATKTAFVWPSNTDTITAADTGGGQSLLAGATHVFTYSGVGFGEVRVYSLRRTKVF
jgi:hypothetical protein